MKKRKENKNYVMLNLFQHLTSKQPCNPACPADGGNGNSERRAGFTLAEVLITLGIIGVVAALTIPSLMVNYQKVQYVTGLKKAYAEITESLRLMANDHGCPDDLTCTGVFKSTDDYLSDSNRIGNELKKYLKVAKDCGNIYDPNDENTKCFPDSVSFSVDGSSGRKSMIEWYGVGNYSIITADGFSILTSTPYPDNCDNNQTGGKLNLNLSKVCTVLWIDVNGLKGPNNFGRDIFMFWITNGKGPAIYPVGGSEVPGGHWASDDGSPNFCVTEYESGRYCAGRIMEQGWQMLY